jgi:predicted TIM-barrel enzyme
MAAPKVYPVIHVKYTEQVLKNVGVAQEAGADGIFLVNHSTQWSHLQEVFQEVKEEAPSLWVGVNSLDMFPEQTFGAFPEADAIWIDNAGIDENWGPDAQPSAYRITQAAQEFDGLYFGGVAFKYQRAVENVGTAASIACDYMDVVTTSGPGTGQAANPEKVLRMKEAMGSHPLAIASGITPENVEEFLPYVDHILVATGISKDFHNLDADKTKQLIETVRSYDATEESSS